MSEHCDWVENTNEASIGVHAENHRCIDQILCLRYDYVEQSFNQSHQHWKRPGKFICDLHLPQLDIKDEATVSQKIKFWISFGLFDE